MHGFNMVGRGLIAALLGFLVVLAAPSPSSFNAFDLSLSFLA